MKGYLYVIRGTGGLLKVGRTERPLDRVVEIGVELRKVEQDVVRATVTGECLHAARAEMRLIVSMRAQGLPCPAQFAGRTEWFLGGDFDSASQTASKIVDEVNADERARYMRRAPVARKSSAIKRLGGTQAAAARQLGISRQAVKKWPDPLTDRIARRIKEHFERKKCHHEEEHHA